MTTIRRKRSGEVRRESGGIAPLSQTAEYALRALTYLAEAGEGAAVRAVDLSEATQVPVHYLSKVLRKLVSARLLISQKGHGGGFVLARPPHRIRFADVLEAVGEATGGERCAFGWERCDGKNPCPLHPAWSALNQALVGWANERTLADVSAERLVRRP